MNEEYSVRYSEGYQAGWNNAEKAAAQPAAQRKPLTDAEIEQRIGYRLPASGFDAIRQLIKENT
jgi:hypothetical protein